MHRTKAIEFELDAMTIKVANVVAYAGLKFRTPQHAVQMLTAAPAILLAIPRIGCLLEGFQPNAVRRLLWEFQVPLPH